MPDIIKMINEKAAILMESGPVGILLLVLGLLAAVLLLRIIIGFIGMVARGLRSLIQRRGAQMGDEDIGDTDADHWYQRGVNAERSGNIDRAIESYETAIEKSGGHGMASFRLANIYYDGGHGQRRNPVLAVKHFRRAAMMGIAPAMDALAQAYQYGEGVVADPVKAYIWCLVAKAAGVKTAGERQLRYESALLKDYSSGHLHGWRGEASLLFDQIQNNSGKK